MVHGPVSDEPFDEFSGDDDNGIIAAAQRALEQRRAEAAAAEVAASIKLKAAMEATAVALGLPSPTTAVAAESLCGNGCGAPISRRHAWCGACEERQRVDMILRAARESLSPHGSRDWVRVPSSKPSENSEPSEYERAIAGIRAIAAGKPLAWAKKGEPVAPVPEAKEQRFLRGIWSRSDNNVLLLGPGEIGKSKLLVAIGHKIIDRAVASGDADIIKFAAGVRYISAIDLAHVRTQHGFGRGEPKQLKAAKSATLLLLDEIGFGDSLDITREIYRARTDGFWRPTIGATGMKFDELVGRYGDTQRLMYDRGFIVNLFPKNR